MGQDTYIDLLEDNKVAGKNEVEKGSNVLMVMNDQEIAMAIITCEGVKPASLCEVCLQHNTTCCPCPKQEAVSRCDGYSYNQSSSQDLETQIRKQPVQ